MPDLNDVALFVNVVRAGSFAEAARRLGIPCNTASRHIRQLEEGLGLRLMQRSTRRLSLTEAGETFYARCADQIEALAQAADELADKTGHPRGRVRVAAPADLFNLMNGIAWVAEFLLLYPDVRLELVLSDVRSDLIGDAVDVAIRIGKTLEPTLIARPVGVGPRFTLVASPAYLALRGSPDSLDALAEHDCITWPQAAYRTLWNIDGPNGATEVYVSGRFRAGTMKAQLDAALANLGIALLPSTVTVPYIDAGELTQVLPGHSTEGLRVYLVYSSRRQLPGAVRAFIEFTIKALTAQLIEDLTK
ncbi:LysR family transcriptional regulator AphB [Paraburkholderia sp. BL6669N2]|uniref:LysR family transcriptional regulator n=1 Tax=Paraburkholderia sp. BL6669N2 TaxID=1938807 RepID=UPI000E2279F5|nr:LysR family transcriptional regulator [Paraburkholderia sp. BL6669N2]REG45495.1 LysR family transcriptional regulator AphB [Paraburkholderia sp. BL6669N2]